MVFTDLLNSKSKLLVVSLPDNNIEYARAAIESGADAIKFHINVKHRVTGKIHATWPQIKDLVKKTGAELECCMGIVPGAEVMASEAEIEEMEAHGLSFLDVYVDYSPIYILKSGISKMLALNYTYNPSMVNHLETIGADSVEVSIVDPSDYGSPLTVMDLLKYRDVIESTSLPCFIPTQKKILPSEVRELVTIGFRGFIVGPIVTGTDIKSFSKAVKAFSEAVKN